MEVIQNLYYIFIETFHMFVADNGEIVNPDVLKNGNGFRNMKMSAGKIGAKLEIVRTGG